MPTSKTRDKIREFNDALRRSFVSGRVMLTAGVTALPVETKQEVIAKVRTFDTFIGANDPYREHDFGSFEYGDNTFFWKIDYYNPKLTGGSEDPADPTKTIRVLTIMLAREY